MNIKELKREYKSKKEEITSRLKKFKRIGEKSRFKEFIFCLLTPQSNAQRCWQAVEQLSRLDNPAGNQIRQILKSKTRFYNNKAGYIIGALDKWEIIRKLINGDKSPQQIRNELVDNKSVNKVKGYGLKEASHFLRNVGKSDNKIAILDRHILKNMQAVDIIKDTKIRSKSDYLEKEQKYLNFAKQIGIPADELDLLFWSTENGKIFK